MAIHTGEQPIYHLDLCSGSGMLGEGIKCALDGRLRTVAYVEREAYAAAALVARMEDEALDRAPVWDDVKALTSPEFVEYIQGFRPLLVSGGYPCQPFSMAGKRRGADDPRHLWPAIDAFIGAAKPECVFFENVSGHLGLGFGAVKGDLQRRGYRVAAGLFTASEVGASHKRERLFILGLADAEIVAEREQNNETRAESRQWSRHDAGGECGPVANTGGVDGRQGRTESAGLVGCGATDQPGGDVGHAESAGGRNGQPGRGSQGGVAACRAGEAVADAEFCLPLFAPGPGETEAWARILDADPSLEPAICRDADGVAAGSYADRLRLTGNGVVPLAAVYAFVSLASVLISGNNLQSQ